MRDRDLNSPEDYLRKVEEAAAIADRYERWERFGNLLDWASADHRERVDDAEYRPTVEMLRARVARALDELRAFIASPQNALRPTLDYAELAARLERIRLRRTAPEG